MLFTPLVLGNTILKNRSIRAAAFEGMCPNGTVSEQLIQYHRSVAEGEVALTTVAYASVSAHGRSFEHQLHINQHSISGLSKLTDAVHNAGGKASIQLGHCGDMAKYSTIKRFSLAPNSGFNMYSVSFKKRMSKNEIHEVISDFGKSIQYAIEAGFDAVEIHAGHGYLISQFLSPYTNHRNDEYGGSLKNRMRFGLEVIDEVLAKAANRIAILVKINMNDGFSGGMQEQEALEFSKILEQKGVQAIILSGGFVSKTPMYVMKGNMPMHILSSHMGNFLLGFFVKYFGSFLVKPQPFSPLYFLNQALIFRKELKLPLIYVGGILNESDINKVLHLGFDGVAIARALIENPNFIADIKNKRKSVSNCNTCNYCIAQIYNGPFQCSLQTI